MSPAAERWQRLRRGLLVEAMLPKAEAEAERAVVLQVEGGLLNWPLLGLLHGRGGIDPV